MFSRLNIHQQSQFQNIFITIKRNPVTLTVTSPSLLPPATWQPLMYFFGLCGITYSDPFTLHNAFEGHLRHGMCQCFIPSYD